MCSPGAPRAEPVVEVEPRFELAVLGRLPFCNDGIWTRQTRHNVDDLDGFGLFDIQLLLDFDAFRVHFRCLMSEFRRSQTV